MAAPHVMAVPDGNTFINLLFFKGEMDLRQLKKEVHALPSLQETIQKFQESWIAPLEPYTNSHLPFLKTIDAATKKDIHQRLLSIQGAFSGLRSDRISHKLQQYTRQLIELKLASLSGDRQKAAMIKAQLLHDEALKMTEAITQLKMQEEHLQALTEAYQQINELLQRSISLEEMVLFLDLPHKTHLHTLQSTCRQQKRILRDLGNHFVELARAMQDS